MHSYILSIGSNIEAEKNILLSLDILAEEHTLLGTVDWIKTKPVGYTKQADFLNSAALIESHLNQKEFNGYLKEVEIRLGRVKGPIKAGPRPIDLDIIAVDKKIIDNSFYLEDYVKVPVSSLIEKYSLDIQEI